MVLVTSSGTLLLRSVTFKNDAIQNLIHDSHMTHNRCGLQSFDYNGAITLLNLYIVLPLTQLVTTLAILAAVTLLYLLSYRNSTTLTGSRSFPLLS